jgi:uncharacterized protein (TIGR03083 family)
MAPSETADGSELDNFQFPFRDDLLVERRLLLPFLDGLTADQWDAPTLCEGWRVREVVAHLTYSWSNTLLGLPTWLRHRDDIDLAFTLYAQRRAKADADVLLRRYRTAAESSYQPPKVAPEVVWCDNVIHGLDMRRPLGLRYQGSTPTLARAAESLTRMTWPSRTACRAEGLQFVATDVDWTVGAGPQVIGPIEDVLLAIAGRRLRDSALHGDGLAILDQRG